MPTIGSALTIFHEEGSPEMATERPGVSAGSPEASYQHLEICTVSYRQQFGRPLANKVREERMGRGTARKTRSRLNIFVSVQTTYA